MGLMKSAVAVVILAVTLNSLVSRLLRRNLPPHIDGEDNTAPGWRHVTDVFKSNVESGLEPGAGLSIYYRGRPVVNIVGGYADREANQTWRLDSLACFFSCTKGVGAITVAKLVDMGLLDYDKPVAKYWPKFAKIGTNITVKMMLSHQCGLIAPPHKFSSRTSMKDLADMMLDAKPQWEPGTKYGYHTYTIGLLMDGLVQHVDPKHRSLSQFFREEIAIPFGIDFHIGLPRELNYRSVRLEHTGHPLFSFNKIAHWESLKVIYELLTMPLLQKAFNMWIWEMQEISDVNNPYLKEMPLASTFGFGTAESLAKLYGTVAHGGKDSNGNALLSPKTVKSLSTPQTTGLENVVQPSMKAKFACGVALHTTSNGRQVMGSPGFGGQMAYADLENDLAWAYVTNFPCDQEFGLDPRYWKLEQAMYDTLKKIKAQERV